MKPSVLLALILLSVVLVGCSEDVIIVPRQTNNSWNQTLASTLFYPLVSNPSGYYNVTTLPTSSSGGDNASWNQTLANTLYTNINTTIASINGTNDTGYHVITITLKNGSTYSTTISDLTGGGDNTSWNQVLASTLYAPISVTGDNTSWNETRANNLYYPVTSNPQGFYNSSTLPAQTNYYTNITALQTYRDANYLNVTGLNTSKALAGASGACTYGVMNFTVNTNGVPTVTCTNQQGTSNLTYALITTSIGNWTLDKPNYLAANLLVGALGNWSLDKSSYSTTTIANGLYYPITSNPQGFYNSSTIPSYVLNSNLVTAVGNWSLDKSSYLTTSGVAANSHQLDGNSSTYYSIKSQTDGLLTNLTKSIQCTGTDKISNVTQNNTGLYAYCTTDQTGGGGGDNASWNQTYANTLYLGLSAVAANSHQLDGNASTYYAVASLTYTNITNLQSSNSTTNVRVDTLNTTSGLVYTNITNIQAGALSKASGWQNTSTLMSMVNAANNLSIDTSTAFFDNTNNRVGIGNTQPNSTLQVVGTTNLTSTLYLDGNKCNAGDVLTTNVNTGAVSCTTPSAVAPTTNVTLSSTADWWDAGIPLAPATVTPTVWGTTARTTVFEVPNGEARVFDKIGIYTLATASTTINMGIYQCTAGGALCTSGTLIINSTAKTGVAGGFVIHNNATGNWTLPAGYYRFAVTQNTVSTTATFTVWGAMGTVLGTRFGTWAGATLPKTMPAVTAATGGYPVGVLMQ